MSRQSRMLLVVRLSLGVVMLSVGILTLGPFQGAEGNFGLTDKEAHAGAFYALTFLLLAAFPRVRKWDVALIAIAIGGLIEVLQFLAGRDGDILDVAADFVGVVLAAAPMAAESLRAWMRGGGPEQARRRRADRPLAEAPAIRPAARG